MSHRQKRRPRRMSRQFWTALLFGPALFVGCATSAPVPEAQVTPEELEALTQRVEDVERTNARLTVRVEEAERQHLLLQDRVESNRIALQRRGYMSGGSDRYARFPAEDRSQRERPGPAPESNYRQQQRGNYQADPSMRQRMDRRGVTRIPLSDDQAGTPRHEDDHQPYVDDHHQHDEVDDSGEEIILTNEILEQRYGSGSSTSSSTRRRSASSSQRQPPQRRSAPYAPVTDERLPTTAELSQRDQSGSDSSESSQSMTQEEQFKLYQDSLAKYRAGDYAQALQGFTRFLNSGPRQDFVDNALYWIGECNYGLGNYEVSVTYFQRIIDELPSADKVPDAMLKMSLAYDRMNQPERAVSLLRELIEEHPTSNPGRLGKERLEEHPLANN